ncbi:hypothetical protein C7S20_10620 [Christiangramia fulva]|uniref:Peptidase M56 domain-containing protein n=1 Tax=Christiangramia fulva TaxID=2126553 RepID=A0A2R3Z634_9FLAO|nr:M56 family metallopeptidase [Christiangramia fulva]AVR45672.1 hypothetical protein C7S20_10620 [Christiangramia fulva]
MIEDILFYLFKSSVLLLIFYGTYQLLLKKETFFNLNRKFLLGGLIVAAIFPAIYFTKTVFIEAPPLPITSQETNLTLVAVQESFDWWEIAGMVYLCITSFFLLRFGLQLFSVLRIIISENAKKEKGIYFIDTSKNQLPFSFFNYIVYNSDKHHPGDLKLILEHEKVHTRQFHSMDILMANLAQCLLWFNPFAWFYKRSIEQNLEFIADREAAAGYPLKDYQHALVKVSVADLKPALTNHFYQSFIKKRILMLNKRHSGNVKFWKSSLVLPLIFTFMLTFNVKTEARILQQQPSETSVASGAISARITKKTTKSELQEFEKDFASHGVKLKFDHVKYSSAGTLTGVDISVKDNNTVNKGSLSRRNPDGIKPIDILIAENGELSLGSAKTVEIEETKATSGKKKYRIIDHASPILQDDKPMVIIDGIPQKDRSELESLSPSKIINITVLENPKATALYGARGRNGVIIVRTKSEDKKAPKIKIRRNVTISDSAENPNGDIYAYEYGKNDQEIILGNHKGEKPLIIIDGEVKEKDFDLNQMEPEEIAAINVLKGNQATEKYGEKGENGVIEINTKSSNYKLKSGKTDAIAFRLTKTLSDNELEGLKARIQQSTGMEVSFSGIKRNSKNEITNIRISGKKDSSKASATWEKKDGIPPIVIGLDRNGGIQIKTE